MRKPGVNWAFIGTILYLIVVIGFIVYRLRPR